MTAGAGLRFYAELNDFLPAARRGRDVAVRFGAGATVKDVIESQGVPHTEVDLVLANGESVGFDHRLADGDRVSVYPVFEGLDISPVTRLRPAPLRVTRFVLDTHLGRLARYLRLLGFDSRYRRDFEDDELAQISLSEGRVLLTRDVGLLKRRMITHGYFIRESRPDDQVVEVLRRFDLAGAIQPFRRCMVCNGALHAVAKDEIAPALLPGTLRDFHEFWTCPGCRRVYWRGSHYERLAALVERGSAEARVLRGRADRVARRSPGGPSAP